MQGKAKVERERAKRDMVALKQEHELKMEQIRLERLRMQTMSLGQGSSTHMGGPLPRFDPPFLPTVSDANHGAEFAEFDSSTSNTGSFDFSSYSYDGGST
jgi:hypothetical protein